MTDGIVHLNVPAVLAIHREVLAAHGGGAGIRDQTLLESAVAAPQATYGGVPVMSDATEVAAAYLFYICRNHPFVDGNKRVGLGAALVFAEVNGFEVRATDDELEELTLGVASGRIPKEEVIKFFGKRLRKSRGSRGARGRDSSGMRRGEDRRKA